MEIKNWREEALATINSLWGPDVTACFRQTEKGENCVRLHIWPPDPESAVTGMHIGPWIGESSRLAPSPVGKKGSSRGSSGIVVESSRQSHPVVLESSHRLALLATPFPSQLSSSLAAASTGVLLWLADTPEENYNRNVINTIPVMPWKRNIHSPLRLSYVWTAEQHSKPFPGPIRLAVELKLKRSWKQRLSRYKNFEPRSISGMTCWSGLLIKDNHSFGAKLSEGASLRKAAHEQSSLQTLQIIKTPEHRDRFQHEIGKSRVMMIPRNITCNEILCATPKVWAATLTPRLRPLL